MKTRPVAKASFKKSGHRLRKRSEPRIPTPIGNAVVDLRNRLGLTQRRFGDLLDITSQSIHRYENMGAIPELMVLRGLASLAFQNDAPAIADVFLAQLAKQLRFPVAPLQKIARMSDLEAM